VQLIAEDITRALDDAGISARVDPHILRHTCATGMLRRGVNLRVVQEALGHSWICFTTQVQVYTHVVSQDVRRAMGGQC